MKEAGLLNPDDCVQIGDVINGKSLGRQSDKEICFFTSIGMGITDLIVMKKIYDVAVEKGIGTELTLWNSPRWA